MGLFTRLRIGRDDNGYVTNEIQWPRAEESVQFSLATGVEKTLVVPESAYRARFIVSPGGIAWIGYGSSPLLPVSAISNASSETNPIVRPMFTPDTGDRITTLRFLSENDCWVNVVYQGQYDSEASR